MIAVDEAHVWVVEDGIAVAAHDVLSEADREAMQRLRFARDQRAYARRHILLRYALSACVPAVAPRHWVFANGPLGRPEILWPRGAPPVRFNISHTRGAMACVVSPVTCGLDIEAAGRPLDLRALAPLVLGRSEQALLSATAHSVRLRRFYELWTLKEAYLKGCGLGLSRPPAEVVFDLRATPPVLLLDPVRERGRRPDDEGWHFDQWATGDDHVVSVALRTRTGRAVRVVRHSGFPGPTSARQRPALAEVTPDARVRSDESCITG